MDTIVFYNDAEFIGGHELLAIEAAKTIARTYKIVFIVSNRNKDLLNRLEGINNIVVEKFDYASNHFQVIRNILSFKAKKRLHEKIKNLNAKLCILVQGNIEISLLGGFACKRANIPCISYIPLTQPFTRTSRIRVIGYIKDIIHRYFYNLPDCYITISKTLQNNLLNRCPKKPVYIVNNKIDLSSLVHADYVSARQNLGLPLGIKILGYIGRLESWHKGLDYYIKFIKKHASSIQNVMFLFVGKGSLADNIRQLSKTHANVKLMDWTSNISELYSAIDAIVLPSRYEGVSLTMLEALWYKLPIIASDIPEFSEFIVSENLFMLRDDNEILNQINRLKSDKLGISNIPDFLKSNKFDGDFVQIVNKIIKDGIF